MKSASTYSHHHGHEEWANRGLAEWLISVFEAPEIVVQKHSTPIICQHVRDALTREGWSSEFNIATGHDLTLFSKRSDLAFQLQTGNMSRAPYDLLKLQYLYLSGRIEAAGLVLPSKAAASGIGENIAHADRVCSELVLFDRVITVPIFVLAFE